MRNVGEQIDAYAVGSPGRRDKTISRGIIQVGTWNGTIYTWLNESLDVDVAHTAASELVWAIRSVSGRTLPPKR